MTPNKEFKELRKRLGLSQVELAAKIGVSQGTITDIERGRIGVSKRVAKKLMDIFDISPFEIQGGEKPKNNEKNNEKIQGDNTGGYTGGEDLANLPLSELKRYMYHDIYFKLTDEQRRIANERITKAVEKQKVIAEKFFKLLPEENMLFEKFRQSVIAIRSFRVLFDNLTDMEELDRLTKIDSAAIHFIDQSYLEFKKSILIDFERIMPYSSYFIDFAASVTAFVSKLKEMPEDILNIDKGEFIDFIELNS